MKPLLLITLGCLCVFAQSRAFETAPEPLTLLEAQTIALKNHPRIAAADYRALAAQEAAKEARAGFFPSVNLYGTAAGAETEGTRIMAGGLNNPSVYDRAAVGVSVNQLITDFGRTANLAASSKFRAQAESANANATREQVLLQVDSSYFNVLKAGAVLKVAQQTFDTRRLLLDRVTLLASNQLKSELDVSFARVALKEAELLVERAQSDAAAAMTSLSAALGFQQPRSFVLTEPAAAGAVTNDDIEGLVQTALSRRPELMSLRDQRQAAEQLARSQRDARLPSVSAVGVAGDAPTHDGHLPDNYAAGGIQISLPLFEGGRDVARQREAEFRAQSDSQLLLAAEQGIVRDVHLAWLDLKNAEQEFQTMQQLVRNSMDAYDLAEARYKSGTSSMVELSQAQLALTSAQIAETRARYDVFIGHANLQYQTGQIGQFLNGF